MSPPICTRRPHRQPLPQRPGRRYSWLAWLLLGLPVAALALGTEPQRVQALISADSSQLVDHIPSVHRIDHWEALDDRHVLLNVDATRRYLLTLASPCHQLGWAQSVDVSRSGSTIWSQFDYVDADGWRCSIGTIHQLNQPSSAGSAPDS